MKRKGFATLAIVLIVVAVLVAGGVWYYESHQSSYRSLQSSTTQTASSSTPSSPRSPSGAQITSVTPSVTAIPAKVEIIGSGFSGDTEHPVILFTNKATNENFYYAGAFSSPSLPLGNIDITFTPGDAFCSTVPTLNSGTYQCSSATTSMSPGAYDLTLTMNGVSLPPVAFQVLPTSTQKVGPIDIESINPTSGPIGTKLNLSLSNFQSGGFAEVYFSLPDGENRYIGDSNDFQNGTLVVTVPSIGCWYYFNPGTGCPLPMPITPGSYKVYLIQDTNSGGVKSNQVSFTVTSN